MLKPELMDFGGYLLYSFTRNIIRVKIPELQVRALGHRFFKIQAPGGSFSRFTELPVQPWGNTDGFTTRCRSFYKWCSRPPHGRQLAKKIKIQLFYGACVP